MTTTTPVPHALAAATTVRVALVAVSYPGSTTLRAALEKRPGAAGVTWDVRSSDAVCATAAAPASEPVSVAIAVCDGAVGAQTARAAWPAAVVVALVPARDDGTATIAALQAGAHVCVRGNDPTLIAAYLQSIARRRGLLIDGVPR